MCGRWGCIKLRLGGVGHPISNCVRIVAFLMDVLERLGICKNWQSCCVISFFADPAHLGLHAEFLTACNAQD